MKIDPFWLKIFIVSGIIAFTLTIATKLLLQKKGVKVSWLANLNQWAQMLELIKIQTKKADKWKYGILLFALIISTVIAIYSIIKS
jgi:heme/copper-type cytochrome/quinol oxidase subunit 4